MWKTSLEQWYHKHPHVSKSPNKLLSIRGTNMNMEKYPPREHLTRIDIRADSESHVMNTVSR